MCGICGFWDTKRRINEDPNRLLNRMLDRLVHRGPDEKGLYNNKGVFLGIRRLNIIGLKKGSQPLYNDSKSLALIFNGEIYNYKALRKSLVSKGHKFYSDTDSEVLIHLYEEYRFKCLQFLKGMFSFALWDDSKELLFLGRDRFGIKPLYYCYKDGLFAFSSEAKSLLKTPFVSKDISYHAVNLYFSLEYIPSPHSIWKDIYKLRPGNFLVMNRDNIKIKPYWKLSGKNSLNKSYTGVDIKNKLEDLLSISVKEHLQSDVPLGFFLSGGLDSSTLVSIAHRFSRSNLMTFSMDFGDDEFDESQYAQIVSEYFNTKHYNFRFTVNDFIEAFNPLMDILNEPLADISVFPTYYISKLSSQYIKVALSGEGADELFMGYPTYTAHKYRSFFKKMPFDLWPLLKGMAGIMPSSYGYFSFDFKLKKFLQGTEENNPALRHLLWMSAFAHKEKDLLFSSYLKNKIKIKSNELLQNIVDDIIKGKKFSNLYKAIQYLDIYSYLTDDLLVKADRAGMCSSLEIRVPYLDHRLVGFLWSLDPQVVFQKRLFKKIMKKRLPRNIINRHKRGFAIPFANWLRKNKISSVVDEFFDKNFIDKQGIFNFGYINSLLKNHISGKNNARRRLRTYIMFQGWYKKWVG